MSPTLPEPEVLVARGVAIHHVDAGPRDGEPLLLLHGITATHRYWRDNVLHLARRRRVIAIDLPGYGRSDKPDAPYTIPWFVDVLTAFLDGKGIDRATVVGNSMGGQLALHLAIARPERVARLVLVAPAGSSVWMRRPFSDVLRGGIGVVHAGGTVGARVPRALSSAAMYVVFRAVFPARPDLAARFTRAYVTTIAGREYPAYMRAFLRSARGLLAPPPHSGLRHLTAPTLIVWGAKDHVLPVFAARRLRRTLPNARLLVYRESGHCPMIDQAERWNRDVEAFLDGEPVGK